MRGIVLAGGNGSRMWPLTKVYSKQLLPIYDKPLIYYPISTLMLAGIKDILIITDKQNINLFRELLGDGTHLGISIKFEIQEQPKGIAESFLIAEKFIHNEPVALILGDNIFHGVGLGNDLNSLKVDDGARIFVYEVSDPERYGILNEDSEGRISSIEEKPKNPKSNLAITGLYFFDSEVVQKAKLVKPSSRGELEITSVLDLYMQENRIKVTKLSRGTAWLDTGTPDSMHEASMYVRIIEQRTGLKIACIEEIAYRNNWITEEELMRISMSNNNAYGDYLKSLL